MLEYLYELHSKKKQENAQDLDSNLSFGGCGNGGFYNSASLDAGNIMENRNKKELKGSWAIKLLFLLSLVIFGYIIYSVTKVFYKKTQVQKEISSLQDEAIRIERENNELKEKVAYFESKDFQEKEVRDKLNLQSPDENLVVVKPGPAKEKETESIEVKEEGKDIDKTPIYRKWWDYFFKY